MNLSLDELKTKLQDEASYHLSQSLISQSAGNIQDACWYLCHAARYSHALNSLNHPKSSSKKLLELTVKHCYRENQFWQENLGKAIIHSMDRDEAQNATDSILKPNQRKLFWQGYFHAEHWDNKRALEIFSNLANTGEVLNIHWYGNLLSKLGRFSEARLPLEIAAKKEPGRYNHHSHLGNVYRALGMASEAEASYKTAARLLSQKPNWGRVEYIHLFRCYHGLNQLGHKEYEPLEREVIELAVLSGKLKQEELERIKF